MKYKVATGHLVSLERSRPLNITKLIFSIMDNGHLFKKELEESQLIFHHFIFEIQSKFIDFLYFC